MNHYADLCSEVTARLVAAIENGPDGWVMPWHSTPGLFDVRNAATGNRYRGANTIILAVDALERGYTSSWWATYRQWSDLDAQVRRGETATRIVKWVAPRSDTPDTITDDDGAVLHAFGGRRLVPKVYAVFNAEQVDGWTTPDVPAVAVHDRDAHADGWIAGTGAEIRHGHNHARYRLAVDVIEVPDLARFCDPAAYYSTICHDPLTAPTDPPEHHVGDRRGVLRWCSNGGTCDWGAGDAGTAGGDTSGRCQRRSRRTLRRSTGGPTARRCRPAGERSRRVLANPDGV